MADAIGRHTSSSFSRSSAAFSVNVRTFYPFEPEPAHVGEPGHSHVLGLRKARGPGAKETGRLAHLRLDRRLCGFARSGLGPELGDFRSGRSRPGERERTGGVTYGAIRPRVLLVKCKRLLENDRALPGAFRIRPSEARARASGRAQRLDCSGDPLLVYWLD